MSRGSGVTTLQMKSLVKGGYYVWCNHHLDYPKKLAKLLGRDDIKVVSPHFLKYDQWRGLNIPGIEKDHAANLSQEELAVFQEIKRRGI